MNFFKPKISFLALLVGNVISIAYSPVVSADSSISTPPFKLYLGAMGSVFRPSLSDSININNGANAPYPYNTDSYSIKHDTANALALQVGYEWQSKKRWFPAYSLGFQLAHYWLETIKGTIEQYSLPQFQNYSYGWDLKSDVFTINSKVNVFQYGSFSPFVNAGVGIAVNHANHFHETAFNGVTPRTSPGFGDNTQYNISYNLGVGIDYFLTPKLSAILAYNYQNLGTMRSGNGLQTWSEDYLKIKNYQINMLVFGVVCRFDSK